MPELPEAEVVRAGLEPAVTGSRVTAVHVYDGRSVRRQAGGAAAFTAGLEGRTIAAAVRRGKYLWFPLASTTDGPRLALSAHLGMSGQLLLREAGAAQERLLRVRLWLENPGRGELALDFVDQRIFGSMALDELIPTADGASAGRGSALALIPSRAAHIARDPLDPAFDDRAFLAALAAKRSSVKRALLDQTLLSGIGNIYADEALWAAGIHGDQPTATLSRPRALRLLAEVRAVLERALAQGGTSFDSLYVDVNGRSGYFSRSLNVYGRAGQPCPRCGTRLLRESFMNRSSHYCPRCQRIRAPRGTTAGQAPSGKIAGR